jgi:hypothetical protein
MEIPLTIISQEEVIDRILQEVPPSNKNSSLVWVLIPTKFIQQEL